MEDNIEKKYIGNRRIILELRFDHKIILADKKGELIESLKKCMVFNPYHWEMGAANFVIFNGAKKEDASSTLNVELNRISFISRKIDSIEGYYNGFKKLYDVIVGTLGTLNVQRIGCRIQGTYYSNDNSFQDLLTKMKSIMPQHFLLEDYSATDYRFELRYRNGMYMIGPVNDNNEPFMMEVFPNTDSVKHIGFAIDTDNYITNEVQNIDDEKLIKSVFTASLSVEKKLFSNLFALKDVKQA